MILINPASRSRMGMIERYSAVSLPMGVGALGGYLLSKGKKVRIVDELITPIDPHLADMDDQVKFLIEPYIFGISCMTINVGRGYEIAGLLKAKYPNSQIVMGGIHATALPEEALNTGVVDVVVRGEGEETLLLLYDAMKNRHSYSDVAGISFREQKSIRHNPDRPLIQDLDDLPPFPYGLFDPDQYNVGSIMTSRGCPYNCIFCSQRLISGRTCRYRSCRTVTEELDLLVNKYDMRNVVFLDDEFLLDKRRATLLCESIVKNRFNDKATFACQSRGDTVDEEILTHLRDAGFTFIGLGMETSSNRLLGLMDKRETVEDNVRAVKLIKKMGLGVNASFLFGVPSETRRDRFETYILAKELGLEYAKFNNIVPYPGTRLLELARTEGTLNISGRWENFNSVGGVVEGMLSKSRLPYVPAGTREKDLRKDLVRANLYFYLSNLSSLFAPKAGNPGWFVLCKRWYLRPKECYYLARLALKVLLNCIMVFDPVWFVGGMKRRRGTSP